MSNGTVTLLVIVFVVCISCGAGYAAYRIVREKLRRLSRMAFGTDSITEGLEQQAKELAVTPKSVSAMTRIFLPQIQRDFPDFHIEQFKDKVENALMLALQAISAADAGIFERQIKDGVSEEFLAQIKNRIRENETEAVTEHYEQIQIHQTEIANYEKQQGTCVITFQSAVGYLHYCEKAGKVLSGSKELTEQTRYNVQLMYIQNEKLAGMDNAVGTTCPNCGAPITNLGAAYCEYCGSAVTLLNLKVWTLHSFDETDYHHS